MSNDVCEFSKDAKKLYGYVDEYGKIRNSIMEIDDEFLDDICGGVTLKKRIISGMMALLPTFSSVKAEGPGIKRSRAYPKVHMLVGKRPRRLEPDTLHEIPAVDYVAKPWSYDTIKSIVAAMDYIKSAGDRTETESININAVYGDQGRTVLMYAVSIGDKDFVDKLLMNGAKLDIRDKDGWTALMFAADSGNVELVNKLCEHALPYRETFEDYRCAKNIAIVRRNFPVIPVLVSAYIKKLGRSDIYMWDSDTYEQMKPVWRQMDMSVDPGVLSGSIVNTVCGAEGRTPLMYAAAAMDDELIKQLLKSGANVDARDKHGRTALMYAAASGSDTVVDTLSKSGALIDAKDESGWTPLMFAVNSGNAESVICLLQHGAKFDIEDKKHLTVADIANKVMADVLIRWYAKKAGAGTVDKLFLRELQQEDFNTVLLRLIFRNFTINADTRYAGGNTALMLCASHENDDSLAFLDYLLDRGANLNEVNDDGQTALMIAIGRGNVEAVRWLLKMGADVNMQNNDGDTALIMSAKCFCRSQGSSRWEKITKMILEHVSDINFKNKKGNTVLMEASAGGCAALVLSLLTRSDINVNMQNLKLKDSALILAAKNGHLDVVKALLADPRVDINQYNHLGETALIVASSRGHLEVVEELLKNSYLDVNARDKRGNTALMAAVIKGRLNVVQTLLENSCVFADEQDIFQTTPLMVAAAKGNLEIVKEILDNEFIDINAQASSGRTALMWAASEGNLDVVKALLSAPNIDVNIKNAVGDTALMIAAAQGHWDIVRVLLANPDIDINATNNEGDTALMMAAIHAHSDVLELISRDPRANIYGTCANGRTDLMCAAQRGDIEILKELLKRENIDVNEKDDEGMTALMIATEKGNIDAVKLLLQDDRVNANEKNDEGVTALMMAAGLGSFEMVKVFLENSCVEIYAKDKSGRMALHYAQAIGNRDIVEVLL